jgi:hypothetical protein
MYKGITLNSIGDDRVYAEVPDARFPGEVITLAGPLNWVKAQIDWYLSDEYRDLEAQL